MLFVIDELEFKYFEFNPLVTDFWLIKEFLRRGHKVFVCRKNELFLKNTRAHAIAYETFSEGENIVKSDKSKEVLLDMLDAIFLRSDPPVDIDYINATYVLDKTYAMVINFPGALRNKNEKIYVNDFPSLAPKNVVTSNPPLIKEFLKEQGEIVIKPTNRCFSSGVFYLKDGDKNTNTILDTVTDKGKTVVMVQEYLPQIAAGDKRLTFICGEIFEECMVKTAPTDDFKFRCHEDTYLSKGTFTEKDKKIADEVCEKLLEDGVFMAGLDVVDGKILEINITSPCFFIKEVNAKFGINFEKKIVDKLEKAIYTYMLETCIHL